MWFRGWQFLPIDVGTRPMRAGAILIHAATMLHAVNAEPQPVPGRLLWPVLERSSVEEDTDLQSRWAALLANASISPERVPPAFAYILAEFSPFDALLLDWLWDQSPFRTNPPSGAYITVTSDRMLNELELAADTLVIVLANLDRNNLIIAPATIADPQQLLEHRFQHTAISTYGVAFVRACRPPASAHEQKHLS